jgi:hypothetical protein
MKSVKVTIIKMFHFKWSSRMKRVKMTIIRRLHFLVINVKENVEIVV